MPRITEELVRRRAEHNNCEIATLEELSLHQQDIEKIEHLDRWCRGLKILYLQNNLIPRIENVSRLKQLTYLNLALNNIETIENLEGCEFLQKLDLTVNFVGDLLSVEGLKRNVHLEELYLTGNPCTDYEGYREYVVATLPQLKFLDGKEITKSERILAQQKLKEVCKKIAEQQKAYQERREREKREYEEKKAKGRRRKDKDVGYGENGSDRPGFNKRWYTDPNAHLEGGAGKTKDSAEETNQGEDDQEQRRSESEGEEEEGFMDETTAYTPESRVETSKYIAEQRKAKGKEVDGPQIPKRARRLEKDGKMLNVNEGRYDFSLEEDDIAGCYKLEVDCPRFMDTSLLDCDIQPTYVRITIKDKILQLVLVEEVSPDKSTAQRSQATGKLLITMPKIKQLLSSAKSAVTSLSQPGGTNLKPASAMAGRGQESGKREAATGEGGKGATSVATTAGGLLEVDPSFKSKSADLANIVRHGADSASRTAKLHNKEHHTNEEGQPPSADFVDDPDVPPLI